MYFSASKKRAFAQKMSEIEDFCKANEIDFSLSKDSYYFTIRGQKYRVSNHSIEASNSRAYDSFGNLMRPLYHKDGREDDIIYIHSSKTRIIEIYNDLVAGYQLDGHGRRKN